ncbi:MAG: hypothetical protein R3B90_18460 [Planctomycetaceae bacterium]
MSRTIARYWLKLAGRRGRLAACLLLVIVSGRWLPAQSTSTPAAGLTGGPTAGESTEKPRPAGDGGASTQPGALVLPADAIPAYYFSPLKLEGVVAPDGSVVDLKARVAVHITRDEGWYDVPLRFPQAIVRGMQYAGPREPVPREVAGAGPDEGLHWMFRGVGVHELTLDLQVPVRRGPAGSSLQLTLPDVPRQFPTQLELTIPSANVTHQGGKDNLVRDTRVEGDVTTLVVTIVGPRVDLGWRVVSERPGTILQSSTAVTLGRDTSDLRLLATQSLSIEGSLSTVKIQLPTDFKLQSLSGNGYKQHTPVDSEGAIEVAIEPNDRGDVRLDWVLQRTFPEDGGLVVIDGFGVRDALREAGTVGIGEMRGYSVLRHGAGDHENVEREDASSVQTDLPFVRTAYRFKSQPFKLALLLRENYPTSTIRPRALVTLSDEQVELALDYEIRVDSGELADLVLRWPAGAGEGWNLQTTSKEVTVLDGSDASTTFPGQRQIIHFSPPLTGAGTIRLTYSQPIAGDRFSAVLPEVEADRVLPAWVVVRGTVAVEPMLDADADRHPLDDPLADEWLKSREYQPARDAVYQLGQNNEVIAGQIVVHPLQVNATTSLQLAALESSRVQINQSIDCQVRYGRLNELLLVPPPSFPVIPVAALPEAVKVLAADGTLLPTQAAAGMLRVPLPGGVTGDYRFTLRYDLPRESASTDVDIPLFQLRESRFASTTVEAPRSGTAGVTPRDARWQPVTTASNLVWFTQESVDSFPVTIETSIAQSPQSYRISKAHLARLVFDDGGRSQVAVAYRIDQPLRELLLGFVEEVAPPRFFWNGVEVESEWIVSGAKFDYRIQLPAAGEGGWLTMLYAGPNARPLVPIEVTRVPLPRFPAGVAIDESFVEVLTTDEQCLLTYPRGVSPLFEWEPGVIFSRQLRPAYEQVREQLWGPLIGNLPADAFGVEVGESANHVYGFQGVGELSVVEVRTASLWVIIFVGSTTALLVSYLLWSFPVTRNVLTLLLAGFLVSLAGVFAAEAVEVLLQPVLLGLLCATLAVGLQIQRTVPQDRRSRLPPAAVERSSVGSRPVVSDSIAEQPTMAQLPRFEPQGSGPQS